VPKNLRVVTVYNILNKYTLKKRLTDMLVKYIYKLFVAQQQQQQLSYLKKKELKQILKNIIVNIHKNQIKSAAWPHQHS